MNIKEASEKVGISALQAFLVQLFIKDDFKTCSDEILCNF
jgi:hypothetical protein